MDYSKYLRLVLHLTFLYITPNLGNVLRTEEDISLDEAPHTPEKDIALQKAVQGLLGLQQIPGNRDKGAQWTDTDFDIKMAPKYMLDLYEKYKDGRIHRGHQVANTVRSIHAEVGVVRKESMFVFNLSSILWSEKVLRAEIHVYKRRTRGSRQSDIYMGMHELGPTFIRKLDHRRIPEASYGWQAADVTSAVKACRHYSNGLPRILAIAFSTEKSGDLESMSVKSLVRRISRPYLIIYSNDTQNITVDHIQPHLSPRDLTSSYVDPSTGVREKFSSFGGDKTHDTEPDTEHQPDENEMELEEGTEMEDKLEEGHSKTEELPSPTQQKWYGDNKFFQYYASPSKTKLDSLISRGKNTKDKLHNEAYDLRRRRSVLDNEIPESPEDEVELEQLYKVPETHPEILQDRSESKRKHNNKKGHREEQLIPYPKEYKKSHRKHRKNRRKNRRQRPEQTRNVLSKQNWDIEGVMGDREVRAMCSKRTFTLDFADIGWSQWIISPRSFEANYCAGTCPFPLPQKLKPSNHATIQSLVHAIGLTDKVPSPCCVPERMSSVTLLYFDESKNVVLKNYPDMSVESCACR